MRVTRRVGAALLAVGLLCGLAAAQTFDKPLTEIKRVVGGEVRVAMGGIGTQDQELDQFSITLEANADVLAAYLYWAGEIWRGGNPDGVVSLAGGAMGTGEKLSLTGVEVGRRYQLFSDENQGGEVVMKAEVPGYVFLPGVNTFKVTDYNTDFNPNVGGYNYYRQYGVTMVVIYQVPAGTGNREVIALEGADVANQQRYAPMTDYASQGNGEVVCFTFPAVQCEAQAKLSVAIGGTHQDVYTVPGTTTTVTGSPEQTFFQSGSGTLPTSLIDVALLWEDNKIISSQYGFKGPKISVFSDAVTLNAGDTWACYQHKLAPVLKTNEFAQNFVEHAAALDIDRFCPETGECSLTLGVAVNPSTVPTPKMKCMGPLTQVQVEYNGQGCAGADHQQSHDVKCVGNAGFKEPVNIQLTRKFGQVIAQRTNVHLGDMLTFNSGEGCLDRLGSMVELRVIDPATNEVLEVVDAKLDCDDEVSIGDQFGSFYLVGFDTMGAQANTLLTPTQVTYTVTNTGTADSGEIVVTDDILGEVGRITNLAPNATGSVTFNTQTWKTGTFGATAVGAEGCSAKGSATQTFSGSNSEEDPDEQPCEGGLHSLTVTYTGDHCTQVNNDQNGAMSCRGDANFGQPVRVEVLDKKGRRLKTFYNVTVGASLAFSVNDLPPFYNWVSWIHDRKKQEKHIPQLPDILIYRVIDSAGSCWYSTVLAEVRFVASCEERLAVGDVFGFIEVTGYQSRR